jgi:hypothetical protein
MSKKTKSRRYNNYTLAIILSVLAGIGVTLALLLTSHIAGGSMPEWLYELMCAIFGVLTVSQITSGAGYSFTGFDILFKERTIVQAKDLPLRRRLRKKFFSFIKTRGAEFVGLTLGFLLAIGLTVYLVVKNAGSVFVNNIPVVGTIVFFITNISVISGLFSRLGRCLDYLRNNLSETEKKKEELAFLRGENVNYVLSVLVGVVIGIVIGGVILGFAGVTSAMTAGGAIPLWVAGAVFFVGAVSSCASACGYIGRVFDFFLGKRAIGMERKEFDNKENKRRGMKATIMEGIRERADAERVGTLLGVSAGLILGIILIATGLALTPFLGMGLPAAAAGVIVMLACISGLGGLGNRIGFFITKLKKHPGDGEHVKNNGDVIEVETKDNEEQAEQTRSLLASSRIDSMSDFEGAEQKAQQGRAARLVSKIKLGFGFGEKGSEGRVKEDFDSGRRECDSGYVAPCPHTSRVSSYRSAGRALGAKTIEPVVSGFNPTRLDVTRDEWDRLRQKVEDGKNNTTYTHYNVDGESGRGKQIKGFGNSRRLHHEAIVAQRADRADQNRFTTRAAVAA